MPTEIPSSKAIYETALTAFYREDLLRLSKVQRKSLFAMIARRLQEVDELGPPTELELHGMMEIIEVDLSHPALGPSRAVLED